MKINNYTTANNLFIFVISIISLYIVRWGLINKTTLMILSSIIFSCTVIIMLLLLSLFALDKVYRPNIPQYPFTIILDKVIPRAFLILPSIGMLILNPFESWFACLGSLILVHICITIPIFHYWSKLRRWKSMESFEQYNKWSHPRLYEHIVIASLYPLLWGLYFSLSRYLRLGAIRDVSSDLSYFDLDIIIILIFFIPSLMLWGFVFIKFLIKIRLYVWNELYVLLYSIHITFLQYYPYFRFMELLYKFIFIVHSLISLHGFVYFIDPDKPKLFPLWRRFINYLFGHTWWFTILFFLSLLIEILLTGKLYYGIYTLFIYPLIRGILYCFFAFGYSNFVFDCCLSDYSLANWTNPRYPIRFWMYVEDAEYYFNFVYEFTEAQENIIRKEMTKHRWKLRKNVSLHTHQDQLDARINNAKYPFRKRLAVGYLYGNRVRWVHTEAVTKFHSATVLFARSIWDKIVLANNSWKHVPHIQKIPGIDVTPPNMYSPYGETFCYKRKFFIGVHEENLPSNFASLINQGVRVEPYEPCHRPVYLPQANPDIVFNFKHSEFIDKRIHALDQKTNDPGLGRSKILSNITDQRYQSTIGCFIQEMTKLNLLTASMKVALNELKLTCDDVIKHQMIWAKYLHLFPETHIPPLRIPQNFNTGQFTKEALYEIKKAEIRVKKVSDYLYFKRVPQTSHGVFPQEALDIFQDSTMQAILRENPFIEINSTL